MRGDAIHPAWLSWWGRWRLRRAARRLRHEPLSDVWLRRDEGEFLIFDGMPFDAPWHDRRAPLRGYQQRVEVGSVVTDREGYPWVVTRLVTYTDRAVVGFPAVEMYVDFVRVFARRMPTASRTEERGAAAR